MNCNNIVLICNLLKKQLTGGVGEGPATDPLLDTVVLPWIEAHFPQRAVSPEKYTDYDDDGYIIHHFVCAFDNCQKKAVGYRSDRAFCSARCRKRYCRWRKTLLQLVKSQATPLCLHMQQLGTTDDFGRYLEKLLTIHQKHLAQLRNA